MKTYTEGNYESTFRSPYNIDNHDLKIFVLDFYAYDEYWVNRVYNEYDNDNDDGDKKKKKGNSFRVRMFGLLEEGDKYYSISIDVLKFRPFFYIKVPDNWNDVSLEQFVKTRLMPEAELDVTTCYNYASTLKAYKLVERKPFFGFTGEDKFKYACLTFENVSGFRNYGRFFWSKMKKEAYWKQFKLYESDIEPILRFIHLRDMVPSGWLRVSRGRFMMPERETSDCQVHLEIDYNNLISLPDEISIPPIECVSFDIESDSSHGDFPVAKKDYRKLAQDIVTEYLKSSKMNEQHARSMIYTWLCLAYNNYYDNNNISRIVTKNNVKPTDEEIECLVEDIYRIGLEFIDTIGNNELENRHPYREYYVHRMHILLGILPEVDFDRSSSHYGILAGQLLKEMRRMTICHKMIYEDDWFGCIKFWIGLAFNDFYDNHEINRVYTKDKKKPDGELLYNLVSQIYDICHKCEKNRKMKKLKKKPKSKPRDGPKKLKPPPSNQRRIFSGPIKQVKQEEGKVPEKVKKIDKDEIVELLKNAMDEYQYKRGRFVIEVPENRVVDREFYVCWLTGLLNYFLPSVKGDPIIQIGTTYKRYGESELYLKHIICLDNCEDFSNSDMINDENRDIFISDPKEAIAEAKKLKIETPLIELIQKKKRECDEKNIKRPKIDELEDLNKLICIAQTNRQLENDKSVLRIECYSTESEVLLAWRKLIKLTDPDVIIGYNLFGFDFKYMWERAEELNIVEEFSDLGRFKFYPEKLISKELKSSGLGDNLLYYINMTGRVIIDLLKVVQSGGYRLPIYKLDYVCIRFLQ